MADRKGICGHCGHELSRHDPEDGTCDAHRTDGGFGVCQCGREGPNVRIEELETACRMALQELDTSPDPSPAVANRRLVIGYLKKVLNLPRMVKKV